MLDALGIGPELESIYRALLLARSASAADLGARLGLPEPAVATSLAELAGVGLVGRTADGFVVEPPAIALGALIAQHRDRLRQAEQALVTLAEQHRASVSGTSVADLVEIVTGTDQIRHRYLQVQHAARQELRTFVTGPFVAVEPGTNPGEEFAVARGVSFRGVIDRSLLSEPGALELARQSLRRGLLLRVADQVPLKLMLADSDLALVPLTLEPGGEPGAVLLHRSGLLAALDALFEAVWRHAHPLELANLDDLAPEDVVERDDDAPTILDRSIMTLLVAGLTDHAVAAQLDVSLRTVQRRLRHLMDLAGVETRLQLGWHACRNQWV
ncbi:MAG: transcriptional regulator TrmB [Hamadaea sp.]|nr:transcriptional regulator TrmB [Hamadaea sp.]